MDHKGERPVTATNAYAALFSALLALTTPTHAAPPRQWTVMVGGATAVTRTFAGVHYVAFMGGGAAPPFAVPEGDKMYWNPLILFPAGDKTYDGSGYHNSGMPGPDGRLSYTLKFTKPGRYSYICGIHSGMRGTVIVTDQAKGTPAAALQRGHAEQAATLAAGRARFANLHVERHGTTFVVPLGGNSQQRYSVLRFTREPLGVPRGSTVTWAMRDTFEIHTVTFTSGEKPPEFVVPEPQSSGPPRLLLNPKALLPP